jgi:hypothetical protein
LRKAAHGRENAGAALTTLAANLALVLALVQKPLNPTNLLF